MRLKMKTTATLLIAIFMISAFAVAVNATPGLIEEGDATAEYSTDYALSGSYSVKLTAGTTDWVDWAGVRIPVGELYSAMSVTHADYSFYYKTDGTTSQTPATAFVLDASGETWKLVEYFTSLDTTVTAWTSEVLKAELFLMKGSTNLGTAMYWGTTGWRTDMGGDFVHQNLAAWKAVIDTTTVDYIEVSIGARTGVVYVDDITIGDYTYDLEESTVTIDTEVIPLTISISVTPLSVNFGDIKLGRDSSVEFITVTNTGDEDAIITADIDDPFYQNYLEIDTGPYGPWDLGTITWDGTNSDTYGLQLKAVQGIGSYTAVLVFWAEAV